MKMCVQISCRLCINLSRENVFYTRRSHKLSHGESEIQNVRYVIKIKKITKYIQVKQQNASNLNNIKAEIARTKLLTNYDLSIDADPNRNYDILEHTITSAINKHLPTKTIKCNKHKHKNSNWITNRER